MMAGAATNALCECNQVMDKHPEGLFTYSLSPCAYGERARGCVGYVTVHVYAGEQLIHTTLIPAVRVTTDPRGPFLLGPSAFSWTPILSGLVVNGVYRISRITATLAYMHKMESSMARQIVMAGMRVLYAVTASGDDGRASDLCVAEDVYYSGLKTLRAVTGWRGSPGSPERPSKRPRLHAPVPHPATPSLASPTMVPQ